jgi:hypothetical protein
LYNVLTEKNKPSLGNHAASSKIPLVACRVSLEYDQVRLFGARIMEGVSTMFIVHVFVHVKPELVEAFKEATIENARSSVQEPGIARFDVVQQQDDPTRFVLVEVYRTSADPGWSKFIEPTRILESTRRLPTMLSGAIRSQR